MITKQLHIYSTYYDKRKAKRLKIQEIENSLAFKLQKQDKIGADCTISTKSEW